MQVATAAEGRDMGKPCWHTRRVGAVDFDAADGGIRGLASMGRFDRSGAGAAGMGEQKGGAGAEGWTAAGEQRENGVRQ